MSILRLCTWQRFFQKKFSEETQRCIGLFLAWTKGDCAQCASHNTFQARNSTQPWGNWWWSLLCTALPMGWHTGSHLHSASAVDIFVVSPHGSQWASLTSSHRGPSRANQMLFPDSDTQTPLSFQVLTFPQYFQIMQFSHNFLRGNPYFEHIEGSGAPWGQNSARPTPDQNPGSAPISCDQVLIPRRSFQVLEMNQLGLLSPLPLTWKIYLWRLGRRKFTLLQVLVFKPHSPRSERERLIWVMGCHHCWCRRHLACLHMNVALTLTSALVFPVYFDIGLWSYMTQTCAWRPCTFGNDESKKERQRENRGEM